MRCPSCTDLSVAQSNATTAIAVRHQIESMVAAGPSTADIDQTLVSEYGQTILLVAARRRRHPRHLDHPHRRSAPARWSAWACVFWRRSRDFGALKHGGGRDA